MKKLKRLLFTAGMCMCLVTACAKKESISAEVDTSVQEATEEITTQETAERETTTQETTERETTTQETTERETTTQETTERETTTQETTEAETTTPEETTTEVETTTQEPTTPEETTTQAPTLSAEEKEALLRQAVQQSLPGIVCWGDSLTVGYGGNGESYPATLQRLLNENLIDGIPVVNNGVCVETTYTIMARAGAWEITTNDFTIPAECYPTEIHIYMTNGMYTNLTAFGDAGLNPVTINGVKGNLTFSYHTGEYGYCNFTRLEPGEETVVPFGSVVYPASVDLYGGYVNIIFMGENGYYTDADDLISQYQRLIDARGLSRYIVIGLTTGDYRGYGELSRRMADYFGDKYIDMRSELVNRGPELLGIERESGDWYDIQEGIVMGYFKSDAVHLNENGYKAAGIIVYEKMDALGYFDGVKSAIAQYRN